MVLLRIRELNLDDQTTHLATDWQVSRTISYNDIVLSSLADNSNKLNMLWDEALDPNIKYYARARVLLSTGYTTWGNLDIFTPENIANVEHTNELPSKVSNPVISTNFPTEDHPVTFFNINATGFGVIGNGTHTSTDWLIEDIEGVIVWSKLDQKINLSNIEVNEVLLEYNKLYRIKAMFRTTTNDSSQFSTLTINTTASDNYLIDFANDKLRVNITNPISVSLDAYNNTVDYEILLAPTNGDTQSIWRITRTNVNPTVTIPANTLRTNSFYLLRVKTDKHPTWVYRPFHT